MLIYPRKSELTAWAGLFSVLLVSCGGGGTVVTPPPSPTIAISPQTMSVFVGQTIPFTATVSGTNNPGVTWSVNDVVGGNATVGTISATGLYTAPAVPPSANIVSVKAAGVANPGLIASAFVTITNPQPAIIALSPSTIDAGGPDTTLTVNGTGFVQESVVMLASTALATAFASSTSLTATIPPAQLTNSGTFSVTVVTPGDRKSVV